MSKRTLSEELLARGFIHQYTAESPDKILDNQSRTVYHGIDPSADSAHAGNMVVWMLLRHLAEAGHSIIFLVGGGTGMIGDPKPDSERVLQDESITDQAVEKIKKQAEKLIGTDANQVTFVNNKDWLSKIGLIEFLRDIGKHFTVNELIKKEAIAKRVQSDAGISYTEFAYPLLQGFDYLTLYKEYNCTLQVGGSDQWGNIVSGVDLVRRKEQAEVHALTVPLVVDKTTGKKFGKSEGNAVWLDPEKTSPYQFYQFWFNTADENVLDYLKLFTFLSLEEIETVSTKTAEDPGARQAQKTLAYEVTKFVHGEKLADSASKVSSILFGDGSVEDLQADEKDLLLANAPTCSINSGDLLVDVLVSSGLASSKREARTFIESGAVTLGEDKVTDVSAVVETSSAGAMKLLRRGKKQLCLLLID